MARRRASQLATESARDGPFTETHTPRLCETRSNVRSGESLDTYIYRWLQTSRDSCLNTHATQHPMRPFFVPDAPRALESSRGSLVLARDRVFRTCACRACFFCFENSRRRSGGEARDDARRRCDWRCARTRGPRSKVRRNSVGFGGEG